MLAITSQLPTDSALVSSAPGLPLSSQGMDVAGSSSSSFLDLVGELLGESQPDQLAAGDQKESRKQSKDESATVDPTAVIPVAAAPLNPAQPLLPSIPAFFTISTVPTPVDTPDRTVTVPSTEGVEQSVVTPSIAANTPAVVPMSYSVSAPAPKVAVPVAAASGDSEQRKPEEPTVAGAPKQASPDLPVVPVFVTPPDIPMAGSAGKSENAPVPPAPLQIPSITTNSAPTPIRPQEVAFVAKLAEKPAELSQTPNTQVGNTRIENTPVVPPAPKASIHSEGKAPVPQATGTTPPKIEPSIASGQENAKPETAEVPQARQISKEPLQAESVKSAAQTEERHQAVPVQQQAEGAVGTVHTGPHVSMEPTRTEPAASRPNSSSVATPTIVEPPPTPEAAQGPVKSITVKHDDLNIRLSERNGAIHVAVSTPDSALSKSLQTNLPEFVTQLGKRGFEAQTWVPASASSATDSQSREQGGSTNHQSFSRHAEAETSDGRSKGRNQQPDWWEQLERNSSALAVPGEEEL